VQLLSELEFVPQFSFIFVAFSLDRANALFSPAACTFYITQNRFRCNAVQSHDLRQWEKCSQRERLEIIVWRAPQSRVAAGDLLLEDAPRTCSKFIIVLFVLGRGTIFLFLCVSAREENLGRPSITRARIYFAIERKFVCFVGAERTPNFEKSVPETLWLIMAERCALRGI
jgi:hypothetical protein